MRRTGECFFFGLLVLVRRRLDHLVLVRRGLGHPGMLADIALRRIPHQPEASTTSGRAFAPSSR